MVDIGYLLSSDSALFSDFSFGTVSNILVEPVYVGETQKKIIGSFLTDCSKQRSMANENVSADSKDGAIEELENEKLKKVDERKRGRLRNREPY